jgi:hypothetical protein
VIAVDWQHIALSITNEQLAQGWDQNGEGGRVLTILRTLTQLLGSKGSGLESGYDWWDIYKKHNVQLSPALNV